MRIELYFRKFFAELVVCIRNQISVRQLNLRGFHQVLVSPGFYVNAI